MTQIQVQNRVDSAPPSAVAQSSVSDYDSVDLATFISGLADGKAGLPCSEHADPIWQDGYRWGREIAAQRLQVVRTPAWGQR